MGGGAMRFALVFTVLVALGSAGELYLLRNHGADGCRRFIAQVVGRSLRLAGVPANVSETTVQVHAATVEVAVECTGIRATAIFCAGALALPCSRRARGVGLLVGVIGVGALNVGRIAALVLVAAYGEPWFDAVHALLMQGFLILFVAPLWVVWMLVACGDTQDDAAPALPNGGVS